MRKPAANDAVAIGRAPLGRRAVSTEMLSVAPAESSERALERSAAGHFEKVAADPGSPDRLMDKKPPKSARSRARERAANHRTITAFPESAACMRGQGASSTAHMPSSAPMA